MVQVPERSSDAVLPDTVHTFEVIEVKLTARPELAVADSVSEDKASSAAVIGGKVMAWHHDWSESHPK
jgi:hypothetical protein